MYFTVVNRCWCIELECECWMKLTYHRETVAERGMVRDFLVCAEPVPALEAAVDPARPAERIAFAPSYA